MIIYSERYITIMKYFCYVLIVILILTFSVSFAQVDKPNELFERVWDGGTGFYKTISRAWEIEAGWDIDKDGKKEFAAFDADATTVYVWESHGNGDNQYDLIWKQTMNGGTERAFFSGDLDNDGFPEMIIAHEAPPGEPALKIYEWDGTDDGIPAEPTATYDPPRNDINLMGLTGTDRLINMDSDPELEFVFNFRRQAGLYLAIVSLENSNLENPSWKVEFEDRPTGSAYPDRIHGSGVGDLNNDGHMDVLCSSDGNPGAFYVFTNTGEDTYSRVKRWDPSELPEIYTGCQSTIVITDINKDGKSEAFIFGQDGMIYIMHDVTDLSTIFETDHFIDFLFLFEDANYRGGVLGNLDGDDYPDLYFAGNASNTILDIEWLNATGDNDVTNAENYGIYVIYQDLTDQLEYVQTAIGDLDGDGMDHGDLIMSISPAVGSDAGIFILEYDPVTEISAVPIVLPDILPEKFTLFQNYPNPFNPETKITYDLSQGANVILGIYTLLGEKITTLIDKHQGIGRYDVSWDGRNENNQLMPSGMYVYRIQAREFVETKKMIFIR
jgi:hypothetical protein